MACRTCKYTGRNLQLLVPDRSSLLRCLWPFAAGRLSPLGLTIDLMVLEERLLLNWPGALRDHILLSHRTMIYDWML